MLLSTMKPMLRKKTIEVFMLANNYHSLEGSDLEEGNVRFYLDTIRTKWDTYLIKLVQNGWEEVEVMSITSEGHAEEFAWKLLNKYDKERYR